MDEDSPFFLGNYLAIWQILIQNQCLPILILFHSQTTRGLGVGLTVGFTLGVGVTGGVTGMGVAVGFGVGVTGEVMGAVAGNPPKTLAVFKKNNGKIIVRNVIVNTVPFVFNLIMRNYRSIFRISQAALLGVFLAYGAWAAVPYEIPKVAAFQWLVRILAVFLAFDFYKKPHVWRIDKKIIVPLCTFLVVAVFASILGVNPLKSFQGNYYRGDGLLTFFSLASFALIVNYFWQEKLSFYFAQAIFVASTIVSLLFLGGFVLPSLANISAGTFGNNVFLAGFLVVSLPFCFYFVRSSKHQMYKILLIPPVVSIFLLKVTSPIVVLSLFVCMLVLKYSKIKLKKIVAGLLVLVALASVFNWVRVYYQESLTSLIAEGRARIFINSAQGLIKRPLLGYGVSNFDVAFQTGNWPIKLNNDVYIDKAHSELYEVLITTGVVGFLIYSFFIYRLFAKIFKNIVTDWGFTLMSVFILYLVHSQTNVISIAEQILFWFVVGYSFNEKNETKQVLGRKHLKQND